MTYQTRARVFRNGTAHIRELLETAKDAGDSTVPQVTHDLSAQLVVIKIGTPVHQTVPDILVRSAFNQKPKPDGRASSVPRHHRVQLCKRPGTGIKAPGCLGRSLHCLPDGRRCSNVWRLRRPIPYLLCLVHFFFLNQNMRMVMFEAVFFERFSEFITCHQRLFCCHHSANLQVPRRRQKSISQL